MGLLDLLGIGGTKEERETRSVRKLQKKAVEKYGPKENRQGAIEELGEMRTPRAVEALLMRYTVRVEPGITDDEEKQRVLALVQQAGQGSAEGRAGPRAAHPALPPRPPGQQRAGPRSPGESSGRHPFRREGLHAEDGGLPARLVQARLEGPGGPEELA